MNLKAVINTSMTLALALSASPAMAAQSPSVPQSPPGFQHISPPEEIRMGGLDVFVEPPEQHKARNSSIRVRINVKFNTNPVDKLTAYPYPVRPPVIKTKIEPLPSEAKTIKNYLMQCCYANRRTRELPYPTFGWRWENALDDALKRTGESPPRTIFTVYPWIHKMTPYMVPLCKKLNDEEEARTLRYNQAVAEFNQKHIELENESSRMGMDPIPFSMDKNGEGQVELQAGTWWIAGSRKVPGLTFFWEQPVTVAGGETTGVLLNEGNALFIGGAW